MQWILEIIYKTCAQLLSVEITSSKIHSGLFALTDRICGFRIFIQKKINMDHLFLLFFQYLKQDLLLLNFIFGVILCSY